MSDCDMAAGSPSPARSGGDPTERPPNRHGSPELVGALQELGAQVGRQSRMRAQELVDPGCRLRRRLPGDEGVEPRAEEEDAAILLDPAE